MGSLCATLMLDAPHQEICPAILIIEAKNPLQANQTDIDQLKKLLPGMNGTKSGDEVMEAAAKYIETLQNNLVVKIRTHGYPDKLKNCNNGNRRGDDYDSIRRAVDNYACQTMK